MCDVLLEKKVDEGDASAAKGAEGNKKSARKGRQLRVLDGKSGQSLSILLGSVSSSSLSAFGVLYYQYRLIAGLKMA